MNNIWITFLLLLTLSEHRHAASSGARNPFLLSAFSSCLRAAQVPLSTTLFESDSDLRNEHGALNGQWKLMTSSTTDAFFIPHTTRDAEAAVRCAELLGMHLIPKGAGQIHVPHHPGHGVDEVEVHIQNIESPEKVTDFKILHRSKGAGLIFEQRYDGILERCISQNQDPEAVDTCIYPDRPSTLIVPYIKMLFGSLYLRDFSTIQRVLMIGLGGGSFPNAFYVLNPNIKMDIVELDPSTPSVAEQWFYFRPSPNTNVYLEDGAEFIKRAAARIYDLVVVDAYDNHIRVPETISSETFGTNLARVLAPGGVAAINLFNGTGPVLEDFVRESGKFVGVMELRDGPSMVMLATPAGGATPSTMDEIVARAQSLKSSFEAINIEMKWLLDIIDPPLKLTF